MSDAAVAVALLEHSSSQAGYLSQAFELREAGGPLDPSGWLDRNGNRVAVVSDLRAAAWALYSHAEDIRELIPGDKVERAAGALLATISDHLGDRWVLDASVETALARMSALAVAAADAAVELDSALGDRIDGRPVRRIVDCLVTGNARDFTAGELDRATEALTAALEFWPSLPPNSRFDPVAAVEGDCDDE